MPAQSTLSTWLVLSFHPAFASGHIEVAVKKFLNSPFWSSVHREAVNANPWDTRISWRRGLRRLSELIGRGRRNVVGGGNLFLLYARIRRSAAENTRVFVFPRRYGDHSAGDVFPIMQLYYFTVM